MLSAAKHALKASKCFPYDHTNKEEESRTWCSDSSALSEGTTQA